MQQRNHENRAKKLNMHEPVKAGRW